MAATFAESMPSADVASAEGGLMAEEEALAAIQDRVERAERALHQTLSLLHDLAERLGKLERAIGLMICAQFQEADSQHAKPKKELERLLDEVSAVTKRAGSERE
jgi:hypothetical protein